MRARDEDSALMTTLERERRFTKGNPFVMLFANFERIPATVPACAFVAAPYGGPQFYRPCGR